MPTPSDPSPLVSICMPVYNNGAYIKQAVQSVQAQTYDNLESIVCNNGSTEDCAPICEALRASDPRIRLIQ